MKTLNNKFSRRNFLMTTGVLLAGSAIKLKGNSLPELRHEPIIDIHQHIHYHERTDAQLLAHQEAMGVTTTFLLPSGRPVNSASTHDGVSNGLQAEAGGNAECYLFAREHHRKYRFGSCDVPDQPDAIYEIEKYLKLGAVIIGELKFGVACDSPEMQKIYDELRQKKVFDESFSTSLGGSSKDYVESSSNTLFAFLLALVLIYLILSAQFESFIDPLIIMLTVPLAIAGAVLSLWLFGQTLNIFSQIGMIMLIGLVTKNGILIVEYANHIRDRGASKTQAAIDAASMRLRPILMTSLAMIFGALPLALSLGAASTSRMPLGIVIVGGVLFSLFLSLLIIPVIYTFLSRRKVEEATAIDKLAD